MSAEFRDGTNKNNIILIDEPEIHLHPSGVEYLRDELMEIAKENCLIIASHSIFIVDKKNLGRHVKVTKDKGETKIEDISEDAPSRRRDNFRGLWEPAYMDLCFNF